MRLAFLLAVAIGVLCSCGDAHSLPAEKTKVWFVPGVVRLDWGAGEMEIRGKLAKPPGAPPPATVWVWAYYVNPSVNPSGSWSDEPIAVTPAFSGDTATIVARGPFHWSGTSYTTPTGDPLPRRGYFAWVTVSSDSPDSARVPSTSRVYDPALGLRVQ
jgi:hypothetical protein